MFSGGLFSTLTAPPNNLDSRANHQPGQRRLFTDLITIDASPAPDWYNPRHLTMEIIFVNAHAFSAPNRPAPASPER